MKNRCLAAVTLSLSLFLSPAFAAFEKQDWKGAGDNMVVNDTLSGVSWLNLSATANKTISQVKGELGTVYAGWRLANKSEVSQLLSNIWGFDMGNIVEIESRSGAYLSGARSFNTIMGIFNSTMRWTFGYVYDGGDSGIVRVAGSYLDGGYSWSLGVNTTVTTTDEKNYTFTNADYSYIRGVYLVRDNSVPPAVETPPSNVSSPSALAAISMLGLLGWRKRRRD